MPLIERQKSPSGYEPTWGTPLETTALDSKANIGSPLLT